MNKEEILARSRNEKKDEGKEYYESQGRRYGTVAMLIMFTILAVFNLYQGQSNHQILAMFFAYLGAESYGMFKMSRKKEHIIGAIVGAVICVVWASCYFMEVLR